MHNDTIKLLSGHRKILKQKLFLRNLYKDFYSEFSKTQIPPGPKIELGSGVGFIKDIIPETVTSDIVGGLGTDKVFSATRIPFETNSVAGFFLLNVLHHIKDPEKAIREMRRCLKPEGVIVMIEPYNSVWAKFIYQNFHKENFDPSSSWKISGSDPLSDANNAIPWIIFKRDREVFEKKFPDLKIIELRPHTPLAYLISGGFSQPQLLPSSTYKLIRIFEQILTPLARVFGMFATIKLAKISSR